jgi:hypothetical protein
MPDLLGNELTPLEQRLVEGYTDLKTLCGEPLPAAVAANLRVALVHYSQAVNDLALIWDPLADLDGS